MLYTIPGPTGFSGWRNTGRSQESSSCPAAAHTARLPGAGLAAQDLPSSPGLAQFLGARTARGGVDSLCVCGEGNAPGTRRHGEHRVSLEAEMAHVYQGVSGHSALLDQDHLHI